MQEVKYLPMLLMYFSANYNPSFGLNKKQGRYALKKIATTAYLEIDETFNKLIIDVRFLRVVIFHTHMLDMPGRSIFPSVWLTLGIRHPLRSGTGGAVTAIPSHRTCRRRCHSLTRSPRAGMSHHLEERDQG